MRAGLRRAIARVYRLTARPPASEEPVEVKPGLVVPRFVLEWSRSGPDEARAFLQRLPRRVDLEGRSVLALGRGAGDLGIEAARLGARRVIALDIAKRRMRLSQARLEEEEAELPIEIRPFTGTLATLEDERYDVILAADAFRRYGAPRSSRDLEELLEEMSSRLEEGGLLAVGFSPLWKAPYGGGIDSRLPWSHLIFPESVIFDEFRRVRTGNRARTFDDIGINRITLSRFREAVGQTSLECVGFATNEGKSRKAAAIRELSRFGPLEEYLTQNVYGVWRRR